MSNKPPGTCVSGVRRRCPRHFEPPTPSPSLLILGPAAADEISSPLSSLFPLPIEISIKHWLRPSVVPSFRVMASRATLETSSLNNRMYRLRDYRFIARSPLSVGGAVRAAATVLFGAASRQSCYLRFPGYGLTGAGGAHRTVRALARRFLSGGERRPFGVWGRKRPLQLRQWPRLPFADS